MTKKNIAILLLEDSDINEVVDFHNLIYKDNRTREEFIWEFYKAPAGKAIYVVAKDVETKKIVGTQCAIPINLITAEGTTILSAKSEDTLVHPDYRGLNIFENMYQLLFKKCRENNIKYIWGFTSAKKPFLKQGFTIPYDHSQSLLVINTLTSFKYLSELNTHNNAFDRFRIFILCVLSKLLSLKTYFPHRMAIVEDLTSVVKDKTYEHDNSHLLKFALDKSFAIKQDSSFLKWRIVNNPYHDQIINISFFEKSKIIANIIFNEHKEGIWYLINDVYLNGLEKSQKISLLNKAVKLLLKQKEHKVNLIRTWDFSHNEYGKNEIEVRKKNGFLHLERGISFVWKILDEKETLSPHKFILSRIATQGVI